MEMLYKNEHKLCNGNDGRGKPAIEKVFLLEKQEINELPALHEIVYVKQGGFAYWTGKNEEIQAYAEELLFLPAEHRIRILPHVDTTLIVIRFYEKIIFCDHYLLENLLHETHNSAICAENRYMHSHLQVNELVKAYFDLLETCHDSGMHCRDFFALKTKELLYLLRAFYSKEDLSLFLQDALTSDSHFSQFIVSNYSKYSNLGELSDALNYTISGFEKRFKRVFKQSPYRWMKEQKAREIFHVIRVGEDNFKEISETFGFNSTSQFNDFVKGHFGQTPGEIRRNIPIGVNCE